MQLLATHDSSAAGAQALEQAKAWDNLVKIRISLQKSVDLGNELPVKESLCDEKEACASYIRKSLAALGGALEEQVPCSTTGSKRKRVDEPKSFKDQSTEQIWKRLSETHNALRPQWKSVTDKWHARLNFGSEQAKSKLKVLNYSMWDQIDEIVSNEDKFVEKTYSLFQDSRRHDKAEQEGAEEALYDFEVYDDCVFHAAMLKTYINSTTEATNSSEYVLNAEELKELRRYKKNPNGKNVDRKASKGRKVRYVPHAKLQNFMFPQENSSNYNDNGSNGVGGTYGNDKPLLVDSDRLFASLFQ
jgi:protein AATF/BFR2